MLDWFHPRRTGKVSKLWLWSRGLNIQLSRGLRRRRIVTAMVTGSNGKTTTTNMLARILQEAGHHVGKCNTEGIYFGDRQVWHGDSAGYRGAAWVMTEPGVTAAALEVARGDIMNNGLYLKEADAAAMLNIGLEHVGEAGIDSQWAMAMLKKRVVDAATKAVILNADDANCIEVAQAFPATMRTLFSLDPDNRLLLANVEGGGRAVSMVSRNGRQAMELTEPGQRHHVIDVEDIPAALGGLLTFNLQNAMAAAGLAFGLGLSPKAISSGLAAFRLDAVDNPGRFTFLEGVTPQLLVNYGSNPVALQVTVPAIDKLPIKGQRLCLIASPDNRAEDHFTSIAREIAGHFDRYVLYGVDRYVRRHEPGWANRRIADALRDLGVEASRIMLAGSLSEGLGITLPQCRSEDLVVVFGEELQHVQDGIAKQLGGV